MLVALLLVGCGQQVLTPQQKAEQPTGVTTKDVGQKADETVCVRTNTQNCDRSCTKDEDCKDICGAGCININERFDPQKAEIDCMTSTGCGCVDNVCRANPRKK